MTIGERIKEIRKQKRMSQQDLASKLGISYVMISQYERGSRKPKLDMIDRIAVALGVEPTDLIYGKEDNPFKGIIETKKETGQPQAEQNNTIELYPTAENLQIYPDVFNIVINDVLTCINEKMPTYNIKTTEKSPVDLDKFKKFTPEQQAEILGSLIEKIILNDNTLTIFYKH